MTTARGIAIAMATAATTIAPSNCQLHSYSGLFDYGHKIFGFGFFSSPYAMHKLWHIYLNAFASKGQPQKWKHFLLSIITKFIYIYLFIIFLGKIWSNVVAVTKSGDPN